MVRRLPYPENPTLKWLLPLCIDLDKSSLGSLNLCVLATYTYIYIALPVGPALPVCSSAVKPWFDYCPKVLFIKH